MTKKVTTQYKLCSRCKKLIPLDKKKPICKDCANAERKAYIETHGVSLRKQVADSIYNNNRYKKARTECRKRANGMCEVCNHFGYIRLGKEAHHIIKVLVGDDTTHYDIDNLIFVCEKCHKRIEGKNKEQLIEYLESGNP